ncbi:MAG: hypothetical protein WAO20_02175 [Acidobacteriota bacterium]
MRALFGAALVAWWACVAVWGARPAVYDHPVDFRLDETAARLHRPAARVLNARIALRKATEEVDIITAHTTASLVPYIRLWKQIDADSLPGAFTGLFDQLRHDASVTDRSRDYEWATSEATILLPELAAYDPDLATELAQTWPGPAPEFSRRARDQFRGFWDRIVGRGLAQIAVTDAERAAQLEAEIEPQLRFQVQGEIVAHLMRQGRLADAEALARQTIRDFRRAPPDSRLFVDFCLFTDRLATASRELFEEAWTLLLSKGDGIESIHTVGPTEGGETISFSRPEYVVLFHLHYLPAARGWVDDLLGHAPDLQRRIERIGGIEAFWRHVIYHPRPIDSVSPHTESTLPAELGTRSVPAIAGLAKVEREDMRPGPARDFIRQSMGEDRPLRDRAVVASSFLRANRDSELESAEIAAISDVLDQLAKANLNLLADDRDVLPRTDEFRLEMDLLMLWSRHDFEDAMRRVEAKPNRHFRTVLYWKIPFELMR